METTMKIAKYGAWVTLCMVINFAVLADGVTVGGSQVLLERTGGRKGKPVQSKPKEEKPKEEIAANFVQTREETLTVPGSWPLPHHYIDNLHKTRRIRVKYREIGTETTKV